MIISESSEQPKKGAPVWVRPFFIFALRLCNKFSMTVNFIAQTFAAIVDRMRFAVDKAFRLRATLFTTLIFDDVDCFRYF